MAFPKRFDSLGARRAVEQRLKQTIGLLAQAKELAFPRPKYLSEDPRYAKYTVGVGSYGTPRILTWGESATLKIGKYCSIADDVTIFLGGEHRTDWVSTYPFNAFLPSLKHITGHPHTRGDVVLENDVWLGFGATLLSGVTVHSGAVVGARSVVVRDVPAYAIVAGNPAKLIRFRFPQPIVDRLLEVAWWDWPRDKVEASAERLMSGDIESFLRDLK